MVNAVREDPGRRGLLFAGTEQAVHVSFDDGESWQSLRLNMPATSIRDLVIKDDDLVVGTHGRSLWILDDITPLRQLTPASVQEAAVLFRPQEAWRYRWNTNADTPLPPDEPAGQNPPDGAIVDYFFAVTRATTRRSRRSRAATSRTTGSARPRRCRARPASIGSSGTSTIRRRRRPSSPIRSPPSFAIRPASPAGPGPCRARTPSASPSRDER